MSFEKQTFKTREQEVQTLISAALMYWFFFYTFTHNPSCPDFYLDSAVSCERVERRSGLGKCNSAVNDRQMSNQDNRCRDASVQTTNSPFVSRFCVVNIQMC